MHLLCLFVAYCFPINKPPSAKAASGPTKKQRVEKAAIEEQLILKIKTLLDATGDPYPKKFTVLDLRLWLKAKQQAIGGDKRELLERMHSYLENKLNTKQGAGARDEAMSLSSQDEENENL